MQEGEETAAGSLHNLLFNPEGGVMGSVGMDSERTAILNQNWKMEVVVIEVGKVQHNDKRSEMVERVIGSRK